MFRSQEEREAMHVENEFPARRATNCEIILYLSVDFPIFSWINQIIRDIEGRNFFREPKMSQTNKQIAFSAPILDGK